MLSAVAVLVVTGCAVPTTPSTDGGPTPTAGPSATPAALPMEYVPEQPLLSGGAKEVVSALLDVAGNRPTLKVDIGSSWVTLTVLGDAQEPLAYRWEGGLIQLVDSDVQYLEQTTFYPGSYPLDEVGRMFETADLLGAGDDPMLQISQYQDGDVWMTVSTRTESQTIFFHRDGTAVRRLNTTSVADIRQGLAEVTEGSAQVVAVGFSPATGYWAEVEVAKDTVERRTRMERLPVFRSRRSGAGATTPLDLDELDPSLLSSLQYRYGKGKPCTVRIAHEASQRSPHITFKCPTRSVTTRLDGRRI